MGTEPIVVDARACVASIISFFGISFFAHRVTLAEFATILVDFLTVLTKNIAGCVAACCVFTIGFTFEDGPAYWGVTGIVEATSIRFRIFGPRISVWATFRHRFKHRAGTIAPDFGASEISI